MRLRWTTPAATDLYNIVRHIQKDNPAAAAEVAKTLYDGSGSLRDFPRRGRLGRIEGTRELVFPACRISLSTKSKIKLWKSCVSTTGRKTGPETPEALL